MENAEGYGRTYTTIRWRDVEELAKYAHAANMPPQTALDNVISLGLKAHWEELENIRFKEWEEEGQRAGQLAAWKGVGFREYLAAMLEKYGRITSREMRELGMGKPSDVIAKLKKRGLHIHSEVINTRYGRQMAVYTLAKRKPPRIRIDPCWEISSFWKWRR